MADTFLIAKTTDRYTLWSWNPGAANGPLAQVTTVSSDAWCYSDAQFLSVGSYLITWSPPSDVTFGETAYVDYTLVAFDPTLPDPINDSEIIQQGSWYWDKFTGGYSFTDSVNGDQVTDLQLLGVTGYVMSLLPTPGRTTFTLWNFDAYPESPGGSEDPIDNQLFDSDSLPTISMDDELIPITNYVLVVNRKFGHWRVFSFDPQLSNPLSYPRVSEGPLPPDLPKNLIAMDGNLLAITPGAAQYTVYQFTSDAPFASFESYDMPTGFPADATTLAGVHTLTPIGDEADNPGHLDYMRSKVKHVVYYVLESRSFDNVVGWLYDAQSQGSINWVPSGIGPDYDGASTTNSNRDATGESFYQGQFQNGQPGADYDLNNPTVDPFHGTPDTIRQQWVAGYPAYHAGVDADMNGFVLNNESDQVMLGFSPQQLSVLNGLALNFAVSDAWYCSEAGGTTTNRASLASGSAYNITTSYEGGEGYTDFPSTPHRQSMWKVLTNHGITDWRIYYSILWEEYPYTYHLFVDGEMPSIDQYWQQWVQPIESFLEVAKSGNLPRFSFLEPVWLQPSGQFTSYHPGGDLLPGEQALLNIYEALVNSPQWEETVLVISFSKGGGNYDHAQAQRMKRAWPNDGLDGYGFDITGARVPTIVVSPLVRPNTVFRSGGAVPYDHTSLAATVLSWFGVPQSAWGMGDRIAQAPTFEGLFQLSKPRPDKPSLELSFDQTYPKSAQPIPVAAPTPVNATWNTTITSGSFNDTTSWNGGILPTAIATFGACDSPTVRFAVTDPQVVNEVHFTAEAPSYEFVLDEAMPTSPTLTIAGLGVTNLSKNPQTFNVSATSTSPDQPQLEFLNSAHAGDSTITYIAAPATPQSQAGGNITFQQRTSAGSANFKISVGPLPPAGWATVGAEVRFQGFSTAEQATFTVYGTTGTDSDTFGNLVFTNHATAAHATITNVGGTVGDGGNTQFYQQSTADNVTIHNQGATGDNGNGGDVAFDGTAYAANATITNYAATAGNGGVTSFNNNSPYMAPTKGASAGYAKIENHGAQSAPSGTGGHTEFTGIYGAGYADHATIDNYGTQTANSTGEGYLLFANYGRWPFSQPSAGHATITNHPGACKGAQAGKTTFKYQNYDGDGDDTKPGPTADNATITNLGGTAPEAPGGYVSFENYSTADYATLIANAGVGGGYPGEIRFSDNADGANSTVQLNGGKLDISGSLKGELDIGSLTTAAGSEMTFAAGPQTTHLVVQDTLTLVGPVTVSFSTGFATEGQTQVLMRSSQLQPDDVHKFVPKPFDLYLPKLEVQGGALTATFERVP